MVSPIHDGATTSNLLRDKLIACTAIRAKRLARRFNRQKNARMGVPQFHRRQRTVQRQVRRHDVDETLIQFGGLYLRHQTYASQSLYFSERPLTISKNADCNFSVIGPRLPAPIIRPSSSRIGVTSAAVPVKNASSAMYTSSRVKRRVTRLRFKSFAKR